MKILHVLDHSLPLHSGYTFRSACILREQQFLGLDVLALTGPKQGPADPAYLDGIRYERAAPRRDWMSRLPVLEQVDVVAALSRALDDLIAAERPDLLHAHSPCLNGMAARQASRRHGLPMVYEMRASWEDAAVSHGTTTPGSLRYRLSRALETRVLRTADAVTTICAGLQKEIVSRGVDPERVSIVPNAVDLAQFGAPAAAAPALQEKLRSGCDALVGFIGSFYAYEGLEDLVAAMPRLLQSLPGLRLLLVGGGEVEAALHAQVQALGLSDRVVFTGRVPHEEVTTYYGLLDVLIYPRRAMRLTEITTPLKPLEAMAQERVVVATDIGGHRELIRHGETGLLYTPGDPDQLAATLAEALRPPVAERLRRAGRDFVARERSWKAVAGRYLPVYESLRRSAEAGVAS